MPLFALPLRRRQMHQNGDCQGQGRACIVPGACALQLLKSGAEIMDKVVTNPKGFSAEGLAKIAPTLTPIAESGDLSGFVTLLFRHGEIAQVNTIGHRDIEKKLPMERDTLFRIASMTKPVTSIAALMLMEEGKFKLDDPITKWAPEFANMRVLKDAQGALDQTVPAARDITFDDLFTHRGGLAYGFSSLGPIAHEYQRVLGDVLNNDTTPDD